ncbi:DNA polymerase III subunit gamma/tau [Dehalococcoidia bacterium]|nr:DNA polymerase III subunit gamma/tau [Dehalococcoidia bacterium]
MTSQVFYRKWRPQTLADVVGQEPITRTLQNALATGRVAHAYLFFGPRGTGKTTTGRILAKAVNCLDNETGEPCNLCSMCQAFTGGRALDLIEIDAASNRSIDEIRALKEKINFAPNVAKFKVYIIDEVHMLTEPAFNALLKTLEEPPSHVIFVLATTEIHKVPATITSRCQRFDFRRIPQAAMVKRLEHICREEGIKADPQALVLIARSATGSLRDAENLLEQMVVYHGPSIEVQQVRTELGLTGDARVRELVKLILARDISGGLTMINRIADDGLDLRQFNRELVDYLREVLLVKADAGGATEFTGEEMSEVKQIAARVSLEEISQAIKLFAQVDFRFSPQATLPLELALVDYSLPLTLIRDLPLSGVRPGPVGQPKGRPGQAQGGEPEKGEARTTPRLKEEAVAASIPMEPQEAMVGPPVARVAREIPRPEGSSEIEHLQQHWNDFVNACRGEGSGGNLDALLRRACRPVSLEGHCLTLGFYAEFQKSKIEDRKYGRMVERKLKEVFGKPYEIRCILISKESRPAPILASESPLVKEALSRGARIISEE